jgi:hypothetical protein
MVDKVADSLSFIATGLVHGITSIVAFAWVAKEKLQERMPTEDLTHAFLADKKKTLVHYSVLSSVYDVLNPYFYDSSMRSTLFTGVNTSPIQVNLF